MATRYYIRLPDPARARGTTVFSFKSQGAEGFAQELQDALRNNTLFQQWRAVQQDPEGIDPALGVTDAGATVTGEQHDLYIDLVVTTSLPGSVFKQRLRLLAGSAWELRDVTAA